MPTYVLGGPQSLLADWLFVHVRNFERKFLHTPSQQPAPAGRKGVILRSQREGVWAEEIGWGGVGRRGVDNVKRTHKRKRHCKLGDLS